MVDGGIVFKSRTIAYYDPTLVWLASTELFLNGYSKALSSSVANLGPKLVISLADAAEANLPALA